MAATCTFVVVLSLAAGFCAGDKCVYFDDFDCPNGCCGGSCCLDNQIERSSTLSVGLIIGIIVGAVIVKVIFWISCCYCIRRRRRGLILHSVIVAQPRTTVLVNTSHAGYDQPSRPMTGAPPTNQPPMPPHYTEKVPPPAYEAPSSYSSAKTVP